MTKTMSSTLGGTDLPFRGVTPIRVPAKVVNVWRDNMGWFCALDDGRVYCAEWNMERPNELPMWLLHIPAIPDR